MRQTGRTDERNNLALDFAENPSQIRLLTTAIYLSLFLPAPLSNFPLPPLRDCDDPQNDCMKFGAWTKVTCQTIQRSSNLFDCWSHQFFLGLHRCLLFCRCCPVTFRCDFPLEEVSSLCKLVCVARIESLQFAAVLTGTMDES